MSIHETAPGWTPPDIASIQAAIEKCRALPPAIIGCRVNQADLDRLKQRADVMPISVGGEASLAGVPISVHPWLPDGAVATDYSDGSTVLNYKGGEMRLPSPREFAKQLLSEFKAPEPKADEDRAIRFHAWSRFA